MLGSPIRGVTYGLFDEARKLVSAMVFTTPQSTRGVAATETEVELIRFASIGNVAGAASRLFTNFMRDNPQVTRVISYSDNDLFDGGLYRTLGFKLVSEAIYDYKTVWNGIRKHKSYTRRNNLAKLLPNFDPEVSEMQNLLTNNVRVIFDSGKKKWEYLR
jgi:hypothetical protein